MLVYNTFYEICACWLSPGSSCRPTYMVGRVSTRRTDQDKALGAESCFVSLITEKLYIWVKMDAKSGALCRRFLLPSHPRTLDLDFVQGSPFSILMPSLLTSMFNNDLIAEDTVMAVEEDTVVEVALDESCGAGSP